MSTQLMNLATGNGVLRLSRVSIGSGRVGYSIAVTNHEHKTQDWEPGARRYSFLTVDAETIRNMARHVEASEKEMEQAAILDEINTLELRIQRLKSQLE